MLLEMCYCGIGLSVPKNGREQFVMYISQKNRIIDILSTAIEAIDYAVEKHDYSYITICEEGLLAISGYMKSIDDRNNVEILEALLVQIQKFTDAGIKKEKAKVKIAQIRKGIYEFGKSVKEQKGRYKAVFMPYKASMWTSLESIWMAARNDPNCDAVVMPLPYYDIGDIKNIKVIYEGDKFPDYVPIMDYRHYNLKTQEPEMGFIHNPYDDINNLTQVFPQYFSRELKKYIQCLVYSPYLTIASYTEGVSDFLYTAPGIYNADKIVAQSEQVSKLFQYYGHKRSKLIVKGSPKIDSVIMRQKEKQEVPEEWKEKLNGKVFLLNTHLSYLPRAFVFAGSINNYATKYLKELMNIFIDNKECSLIWRPHPLSRSMLEGRFPEYLEFVNDMEKKISCSKNCVMDKTEDYMIAFQRSDALISTYSSLINEYMMTGKPVMIFQKQQPPDADARALIKRNMNYFKFGPGKLTFSEFVNMVIKGEDPKYGERMEMLKQAFENMDGSAGKKIYNEVVKEILVCE